MLTLKMLPVVKFALESNLRAFLQNCIMLDNGVYYMVDGETGDEFHFHVEGNVVYEAQGAST